MVSEEAARPQALPQGLHRGPWGGGGARETGRGRHQGPGGLAFCTSKVSFLLTAYITLPTLYLRKLRLIQVKGLV